MTSAFKVEKSEKTQMETEEVENPQMMQAEQDGKRYLKILSDELQLNVISRVKLVEVEYHLLAQKDVKKEWSDAELRTMMNASMDKLHKILADDNKTLIDQFVLKTVDLQNLREKNATDVKNTPSSDTVSESSLKDSFANITTSTSTSVSTSASSAIDTNASPTVEYETKIPKIKKWECLVCHGTVEQIPLETQYQFICHCNLHQFICVACFEQDKGKTTTKEWRDKFGPDHCVRRKGDAGSLGMIELMAKLGQTGGRMEDIDDKGAEFFKVHRGTGSNATIITL